MVNLEAIRRRATAIGDDDRAHHWLDAERVASDAIALVAELEKARAVLREVYNTERGSGVLGNVRIWLPRETLKAAGELLGES